MSAFHHDRANRYDLLRLIFAFGVIVSHALQLPGKGIAPEIAPFFLELSEISVRGFFVISGALVYASLGRSETLGDYAMKRTRRLYPAYTLIILIPVCLSLGLIPETRANIIGVGKYLAANLIFLNFLAPDIPGLFQNNRFSEVNGALWTIKIEVMFYMALPILAWILKKVGPARLVVLILIYIAAEVWRQGIFLIGVEQKSNLYIQLSRQLPGQMSFFVAGMLAWDHRSVLREKYWIAGLVGLIGLGLSYLPFMEWALAASLALLITAIATAPGPKLNVVKYGDFSYGSYIWHFPVIQSVIVLGFFQMSLFIGVAISFAVTILLAVLTWHFVEKPCLSKRNWYRRASER